MFKVGWFNINTYYILTSIRCFGEEMFEYWIICSYCVIILLNVRRALLVCKMESPYCLQTKPFIVSDCSLETRQKTLWKFYNYSSRNFSHGRSFLFWISFPLILCTEQTLPAWNTHQKEILLSSFIYIIIYSHQHIFIGMYSYWFTWCRFEIMSLFKKKFFCRSVIKLLNTFVNMHCCNL